LFAAQKVFLPHLIPTLLSSNFSSHGFLSSCLQETLIHKEESYFLLQGQLKRKHLTLGRIKSHKTTMQYLRVYV